MEKPLAITELPIVKLYLHYLDEIENEVQFKKHHPVRTCVGFFNLNLYLLPSKRVKSTIKNIDQYIMYLYQGTGC